MRKEAPIRHQQQLQIQELQARLDEAEDALRAIRSGEVDALVVSGSQGDQVFTLKGADQAYRVLVETMNEGTVMLLPDGTVGYSNSRFSEMVRIPLEQVMGSSFTRFLPAQQQSLFSELLEGSRKCGGKAEFTLLTGGGMVMPALLSVRPLGDTPAGGYCVVITDLTDQKHAEAERSYLAGVVESSDDAIIGKSPVGVIQSWNSGAERLYGYAASEVLGQSAFILVPPECQEEFADLLNRIKRGEKIEHHETVRVAKGGRHIDVSVTISPLKNAAGDVVGASSIARDITRRMRAKDALRRANAYNRSLIEASLDPLVTIAADGKITDVNSATEKVTGRSRDELIGSDFCDYFTDPEKARAGDQKVFREGWVQDYEMEIHHRDGHATPVLYNASVYRDEAGQVAGVLAAARDITARKRVERDLALSRERLDLALRAGQSGTFDWDIQNNINVWSPEVEALYGLEPGTFGGTYQDWETFLFPEDLETAKVGIQEALKSGEFKGEWRIRRQSDGETRWLGARAKVFFDQAGRPSRMIGINTDITERKRVEEAFRQASAYNRSLIEASLDPLVTIAPDGKITDANTGTEKATGRVRQELIGTDFCDYFTQPEKARAGYQRAFREGFVQDYELEILHRDGHNTPVLYNASVYRDEAGKAIGLFATARDITERKRAEQVVQRLNEQLEQRVHERTAELEAANKELEAFTYSVSHDLRAPLRHVDGYSKLLVDKHGAELSPDAREDIATIRDSVLHMGMLIDDLLNLARVGRTQLSMQVTGLNPLLEEVRADLMGANPDRVIEWKVETLPFVECDPALIKQVFANLLSNAVKFTRPRNPAVIEVGTIQQDDGAVVFVRDNGVGFSMKYVNKLFGVFQRLHRAEDFEGTGVGLATVQRIIHKHGGRVWVEAALNHGATFYFTLNASGQKDAEAENGNAAEGRSEAAGGCKEMRKWATESGGAERFSSRDQRQEAGGPRTAGYANSMSIKMLPRRKGQWQIEAN